IGYKSFGQYANHRNLLNNLIEYFFSSNNVSLNILLDSPNSGNSNINLSIYAKNRSLDSLIDSTTLNTYLNVSIKNDGFYEEILTFSPYNGYANNYTYSLPFPNSNPYEINANITIDSHVFIKSSKYLYFDDSEIPKITNVTSNKFIVRNGTDSLYIDVFLDAINYNCTTYLSIYPSSYYSKTETINKTFELNNSPLNLFKYSVNYTALQSDPAGLGIFFITPQNPSSNYINPNTPRLSALFVNNPPQFNEDSSTITIDNNQVLVLSDTYEDDSLNVFSVSQGSILNLKINVSDSVDYEDQDSSNMNVSVNFFIASITQSNSLIPIDPTTNIYSLLTYDGNSNIQRGTFTIPFEMSFPSITGFKSISTVSTYNNLAQDGYIGLIWITVYDSEGESEYFIVVFLIQEGFTFDLILAIVIIGVIMIAGIGIIIFAHVRKKKRSKFPTIPTYYLQEENQYSSEESPHANVYYCPFCGQRLSGLRNFCPTCGKSLNIEE
ncbi:MAG: hypothetical protein ACFFKA_05280, partial [Candidatus Thorarchaeota archaeon]